MKLSSGKRFLFVCDSRWLGGPIALSSAYHTSMLLLLQVELR